MKPAATMWRIIGFNDDGLPIGREVGTTHQRVIRRPEQYRVVSNGKTKAPAT